MTEKPSTWIRLATAAKLRGVSKQSIKYHVNRVREGKSNQQLRFKDMDGVIYVSREDIMNLTFQTHKLDQHKLEEDKDKP